MKDLQTEGKKGVNICITEVKNVTGNEEIRDRKPKKKQRETTRNDEEI